MADVIITSHRNKMNHVGIREIMDYCGNNIILVKVGWTLGLNRRGAVDEELVRSEWSVDREVED